MASYGSHTFSYGADGIRYKKDSTTYTLDGSTILKETNGTRTITYFYGVGGVAGFQYNGINYYYQKNLQGDVIAIYDANGIKQAEYIYNAWGKVLSVSNCTTANIGTLNPFRYRSYYYDVETDLYYLETRYYDPEIGRFINADDYKYLGEGKELSNYNLFVYCENTPIKYTVVDNKYQVKQSYCSFQDSYLVKFSNQFIVNKFDILSKIFQSVDEDTAEKDSFFTPQDMATVTLLAWGLILGNLAGDGTAATSALLGGIGYMVSTPVNIVFHVTNPKLDDDEKAFMVGYELAVAGGGIAMTYAIVNCWNPSGWVVLLISAVYALGTYRIGTKLVKQLENN